MMDFAMEREAMNQVLDAQAAEARRKAHEALRNAYADVVLSVGQGVAMASAFDPDQERFIAGQAFFHRAMIGSNLVRAGVPFGDVLAFVGSARERLTGA